MGTDNELSKVVLELEMDEDYDYLLGIVAFLYNAGLSRKDIRKVLGSSYEKIKHAVNLIRRFKLVDESLRYRNTRILYHKGGSVGEFTPSKLAEYSRDKKIIIYNKKPYISLNKFEIQGILYGYNVINDFLHVFEEKSTKDVLHFKEFVERVRRYEKIKEEVRDNGA